MLKDFCNFAGMYTSGADICSITDDNFESKALEVFRFQYVNNSVYRQFCDAMRCDAEKVTSLRKIPFLPISLFKTKDVITTNFEPAMTFRSSGTTGSQTSRHLVKDPAVYEKSFFQAFSLFYGKMDFAVIGLLPSYLERSDSSLVYMVNELIKSSGDESSGFYLDDHKELHDTLISNEAKGKKTLLIGVTYALLDFASGFPMKLKHTIVMETGGMKGRKKEMTRQEVHEVLISQLGLTDIHSEYGMTELLSQAYSRSGGIFNAPPWMKMLVRAEDDPRDVQGPYPPSLLSGVANIIDLANIYSCSFIAADDVIRLYPDASFEVLGRVDNSDVRGCGLMVM